MHRTLSRGCRASLWGIALSLFATHGAAADHEPALDQEGTADPVITRLATHLGDHGRPIIVVVGAKQFPPPVWNRVKGLVAFRLHRRRDDGTTVADAPIYLVRNSDVYLKAAAALRTGATQREYVWCLLAAIVAHESAHNALMTERQALTAELAQLRRCLLDGHMFTGDGWNAAAYIGTVDAKLRHPREHY
jgi:hypothetical protein